MPTISQSDAKLFFVPTDKRPGDDDWELLEFNILGIPADPDAVPALPQINVHICFDEPLLSMRQVHTFIGYDGQILSRWLMETHNGGLTWESVERLSHD